VANVINSIGLFQESRAVFLLHADLDVVGLWYGVTMPFDGKVQSAEFFISDIPKKRDSIVELVVAGVRQGPVTFVKGVVAGTIIKQVFSRGACVFRKGRTIRLEINQATDVENNRPRCVVTLVVGAVNS